MQTENNFMIMRMSFVKDPTVTLACNEVCELPCPATVEAEDVVVPHHTPAAIPHAVDAQHFYVISTRGRFTYDFYTRQGGESFKERKEGMDSREVPRVSV